jgi:hypothetical protein
MYQLNKNYNLGNGMILENPAWELAPTIDDGKNKTATINVLLNPGNGDYNIPFEYNYAASWEDSDLCDYVITQPGFEDSTIIQE